MRRILALTLLLSTGLNCLPETYTPFEPPADLDATEDMPDTPVDGDQGPSELCGNGEQDEGEECDDGVLNDDSEPDACRTDCKLPTCGDSVIDDGEECDDGPLLSDEPNAACRTSCKIAGCGDGIEDDGEACDEGDANDDGAPDACRTTCELPECGDGVQDTGEGCDDGNGIDADDCSNACIPLTCGNGTPDDGEECDAGDQNAQSPDAVCRENCQFPTCGDMIVDPGLQETCDTGAERSDTRPDACRTDCTEAGCGDGVTDTGEMCDEGSANAETPNAECRTDCSPRRCGDSVTDDASGEECDSGSMNSDSTPDACRTSCLLPSCGDGVQDTGESCDDPNGNSDAPDATCRTSCEPRSCGDGIVDPIDSEQCDSGSSNSNTTPDACRENCQEPSCGDGVVDPSLLEGCDEGNANADVPNATCRTSCEPRSCGDAIIDSAFAEQCDQGAGNSNAPNALCRTNCSVQRCGDGITDPVFNEDCDEGALNSDLPNQACRVDCSAQRCGDGIVDDLLGEACDDGNGVDLDTCTTECSRCGNGTLDPGEQCDDGAPRADGDGCDVSCQIEPGWVCQGTSCYRRLDKPAPVAIGDQFGFVIEAEGDLVVVGAPFADDHGQDAGMAYVYERDMTRSSGWRPLGALELPLAERRANAYFGQAIAIEGNDIVVAAPGGGTQGAGALYVFRRSGGSLVYALKAFEASVSSSGLMEDIALCQGRLLVSAPELSSPQNTDGGTVAVFATGKTEFGPPFEQYFLAPATPTPAGRFGQTVACNDSHVVVTATSTGPGQNEGALFWTPTSSLPISASPNVTITKVWSADPAQTTRVGRREPSLSLDGSSVLLGAEDLGGVGGAYLFDLGVLPGGNIDTSKTTYLGSATGHMANSLCGYATALSPTHAYVGCLDHNGGQGRAYGVARTGGAVTYFEPGDPDPGQQAGFSLGYAAGHVFYGAPSLDTSSAANVGAVYHEPH